MTSVLNDMTASLITLGCKLNQYESMSIRETLEESNVRIVSPESGADIYIINTCTVTGKTDRRSRNAVRRVLKWNPKARIIVTGCSSQRQPLDYESLPNVILVTGNQEKSRLKSIIIQAMNATQTQVSVSDMQNATFNTLSISTFGKYSRAFIKIQEGCSRNCSYCVIPNVRGPSRSQTIVEIAREVQRITENGFQEIVLTGIDLGTYGLDLSPSVTIVDLLKHLLSIRSLARIRLSSIEPTELLTDLITLILNEPRICRHLHIPLQSGCQTVLDRMKRGYTTDFYRNLLLNIKSHKTDMCIGADVIVAFPAESDQEFQDTYDFIHELPIDYLHVFSFSPRHGTPAATFPDQISPPVAKNRCHLLRTLSMEKAVNFRSKLVDRNMKAIVLGSKEPDLNCPVGLTDNYIKVALSGCSHPPGSLVEIQITHTNGLDVFGRVI